MGRLELGEGLVNLGEILWYRGSRVDLVQGIGSRRWEVLMIPWADIPGTGKPERGDYGHPGTTVS